MTILHFCTTEQAAWTRRPVAKELSGEPQLLETGAEAQVMKGFGGCFNELGWSALQRLTPEVRSSVLDALFGEEGCRFNFCRLPIGASDYALDWYSLNEHRGDLAMAHFSIDRDRESLIPFVKAAQAIRPSMTFFASPWSPPTWMKSPAVYNHGTLRWEPAILEAYALYLRRYVEAYAAAGIPVAQLHVQNEPVSDQKFPSCVWTGDQLREFIGRYLGPHFTAHGVPADIWLGTINGPEADHRWDWTRYDHYAHLVLSDPEASRYVKGVAYQWAGKHAIQRTHEAWPDMPLIQSENECGDGRNTWTYAMYVYEMLWHYLSNHAVAYVYWNMVLLRGGVSTWGWKQNSMVTIDPETSHCRWEHEFWVMKHVSRYVDPGAVRLRMRGPWTGNSLLFRNPDGRRVLTIANPFSDARVLRASLGSQQFETELPPASLNTFVLPAIV